MENRKGLSALDMCRIIDMEHKILGSKERYSEGPASLETAKPGQFAFCSYDNEDALKYIKKSNAGILIVCNTLKLEQDDIGNKTIILVEDPKLAFVKIASARFSTKPSAGIHPSATIDDEARLQEGVHIGPHSVIGRCEIGSDAIIFGNNYLYHNVKIGEGVVINAGSVIGRDGVGHIRDSTGKWIKFPHYGGVIIEKNVEIGGNVCIDKGTFDNTVIGEGSIINNFCHIGHNVRIGKNCLVGVGSIICGSSKVGNNCWVSPGSMVRDTVKIGNDVVIGMGSVVVKDIGDGCVVYGVPARVIRKKKDTEKY